MKNLDLNEAVSTVQSALNQAVIAKDCLSGTDYEFDGVIVDEARFCGIGMYIPKEYNPYVANKTAWNDYYEQSISWYHAQVGRFNFELITNFFTLCVNILSAKCVFIY